MGRVMEYDDCVRIVQEVRRAREVKTNKSEKKKIEDKGCKKKITGRGQEEEGGEGVANKKMCDLRGEERKGQVGNMKGEQYERRRR